jgi:predicted membrane protein
MGWVLVGIGLIALGVILLVDRMGHWDAGDIISQWWPTVIIAVGLAQLAGRPRPWLGSLIVVAVGVVLLIHQLGHFPDNAWDYIWPSLIIAAGVWVLVAYVRKRRRFVTSAESVQVLAVFGDAKTASNARTFIDGSVTAIFGGAELDLYDAGLSGGRAEIAATAIFGDAVVVVPEKWDVELSSIPILGDVKDETSHGDALPEDAPRLRVRGVAILGDVKVRHRR